MRSSVLAHSFTAGWAALTLLAGMKCFKNLNASTAAPIQVRCCKRSLHFYFTCVVASAGNKRARSAWEDCSDVAELKRLLSKQLDQIDKLTKEKTALSKALKAAEGQPVEQRGRSGCSGWRIVVQSSFQHLSTHGIYRNKHSSSRVSADVPNVSLSQANTLL